MLITAKQLDARVQMQHDMYARMQEEVPQGQPNKVFYLYTLMSMLCEIAVKRDEPLEALVDNLRAVYAARLEHKQDVLSATAPLSH